MFLCFVLVFLFHSFPSDAQLEKHYLHYKFTAISKTNTFPEFSAVAVSDGRRVVHYNNKSKSWVRESLTDDDWTKSPSLPPDSREWFIHQMKTLSNCGYSGCSELHVLQRIIGCELEKHSDGTVHQSLFDEYGFDGEDFIAFNSDTMQWIDKNPKATETKMDWDHQTERNQFVMGYLQTCVHWISTFNNTKKSRPNVYVFVERYKQHKQVLICLVTDFYPKDIEMKIRLNRINMENQTSSGIRPNGDGSFQMRASVEIDKNDEGSYDCHVIHSSLTEPASVEWDATRIDCATKSQWPLIAGIAVLLVITVLTLIGYYFLKNYHMNRSDVQTTGEDRDTGNKRKNKRKRGKRFYIQCRPHNSS
ncbi:zinc-alpha-2-glycoprotein-like isoform X1 [Labeo rohita]|uniref:zinc-alpha-2-glycoprotein-like isoform X1 n=1 Tax=Labeo rohita TaxID=84645 RepID=UPI0021E1C626|nr:zinc-alpha-2-glycoprotein-like isoform X1 [Labeo rohita]